MKEQVIWTLKDKYYLYGHQIVNHRHINHETCFNLVDKYDS